MTAPLFTVVGTPGGRRVRFFAGACLAAGLDAPRVIAWRDVLTETGETMATGSPVATGGLAEQGRSTGGDAWFEPGGFVRIESPGEDPEADALLRGPGDPTRVGGGARWYSAFMAGVRHIAATAQRAGARLLNDPDDIAVMFDKRLCHARLEAAGVPVPPALQAVRSYAELRGRMSERGWRRVFVKPAHGSSASGVVALQVAGARIKAVTSAVPGPEGFHNSLRVRSYETEREVAALVDALAPDGLHVERWVPKVSPGGRALDLRVVVVAGAATHAVVRTSRWPMTNLHLGGRRGDLDELRNMLGPDRWRQALDVCVRAAGCFPGSLMAGVDLLIGLDGRLAVAEVNAFGDLLPGLTGLPGSGAEGLDTYSAQVRACFYPAHHHPSTDAALAGVACAT